MNTSAEHGTNVKTTRAQGVSAVRQVAELLSPEQRRELIRHWRSRR